jgi:hypothetical protein
VALTRWALGVLLLAAAAAVLMLVGTASVAAVAVLLGAASAACLGAGWVRAGRAARAPRGRRCLECGAIVPAAAVCPWCQGVTFAVGAAPGGGADRGGGAPARDRPGGAYSADPTGGIGWVDAEAPQAGPLLGEAPPDGAGAGPPLRVWGAGLLAGAGFFAMLAVAEASGAWGLAVLVFCAGVAGSALLLRVRSWGR